MSGYLLLAAVGVTFVAWLPSRDWRVPMNAAVIAAGALAVGRAGFVALNWPYFSEHQNEIASFAGISEHAAIAGATIGYWLLAKAHQPLSTLHLSLVTALLLVGIAASIGCIPNGRAFGREVFWQTDGAGSLAWLLRADWPDATLTRNPRWPAQALLAGWLTLGLVVLMRLSWKLGQNKSMLVMPVALLWFAGGDFMVQFTRGDAVLMLANVRIYQGFDVMLAVVSILVLTRQILRKP
jgi:prolipoprotein diacylglyceryltransferase